MKNGKYGLFVAAIVMLAMALFGVVLFAVCCADLAAEVSESDNDVHSAAFAALFAVVIGIVVGAGVFGISALGLLFSALAFKRAERRAYRITSTVLCVLHSILVSVTLLPTLYMICFALVS